MDSLREFDSVNSIKLPVTTIGVDTERAPPPGVCEQSQPDRVLTVEQQVFSSVEQCVQFSRAACSVQ